jgi:hypothetical protein
VCGGYAAPVHEHNASGAGPAVELRVGLHSGEPVRDGKDYHGEAVVVAKRLCDLAGGGQIFTSEPVASLVGSRGGFSFRSAGRLPLKGLPRGVAAVTVDWLAGKPLPGRRPVSGRGGAPAPEGTCRPHPGARRWWGGPTSWPCWRTSSNDRRAAASGMS